MTNRSEQSGDLSAEWADAWLEELEGNPRRRRKVARERFEPDEKYLAVKAFEAKTEQLRRFLRRQHEMEMETA